MNPLEVMDLDLTKPKSVMGSTRHDERIFVEIDHVIVYNYVDAQNSALMGAGMEPFMLAISMSHNMIEWKRKVTGGENAMDDC